MSLVSTSVKSTRIMVIAAETRVIITAKKIPTGSVDQTKITGTRIIVIAIFWIVDASGSRVATVIGAGVCVIAIKRVAGIGAIRIIAMYTPKRWIAVIKGTRVAIIAGNGRGGATGYKVAAIQRTGIVIIAVGWSAV